VRTGRRQARRITGWTAPVQQKTVSASRTADSMLGATPGCGVGSGGAAGERGDTLPFVLDLRGVDQFRELIRLLERRGYRSERIEKILGRNFLDYAGRVWAPEGS
jgi:microsomal dipeptidase-like Zn-dependent dipeptidase